MADGPFLRALFRTHLWLSARLMPVLIGQRDFETVLKWAPLDAPTPYQGLTSSYIVTRVNRTVRHPWLMRDRRCLREGLLGFRFLRMAGFDPELRFGVDSKSMHAPRLSAHCWVYLDGKPVVSDSLPGMVEIYRHHAAAAKGRAA
ncbi:lasso peptide biosynthesis B2 protein [Mesorhizobium sp. VK22B]|uniref:Lasso peptide biosynthesis B2 protein n=1 Tax=Mesorhizobium captivum TaxID=3072319 RepID=A0ABU4YYY5_9HYPH|nr:MULTISPECIES: lasso peptide biosynthesis B2 protein [unclassified Mesorhizobium]MDX8492182.1 lasso peptide biosynthesis B2 protein [Mesorhizobium sp. VK22B]MDX8510199.1 lasso peptide biosynthesis B2 protein [Mesorhizobium sp. VK22E]